MRYMHLLVCCGGLMALWGAKAAPESDCLTGRAVFVDGDVATISGMRSGARITETFVQRHGSWILWMRYAGGRAEHPTAIHRYACAAQPIPLRTSAPVDAAAGARSAIDAEAHWLTILRTGNAQDLPATQIAAFAGIRQNGFMDNLQTEMRLMPQRKYAVVANCITHPRVFQDGDIVTVWGPYNEYARASGKNIRIRYDSADTFVRRQGRWYAATGFARFLGWQPVLAIPKNCGR